MPYTPLNDTTVQEKIIPAHQIHPQDVKQFDVTPGTLYKIGGLKNSTTIQFWSYTPTAAPQPGNKLVAVLSVDIREVPLPPEA